MEYQTINLFWNFRICEHHSHDKVWVFHKFWGIEKIILDLQNTIDLFAIFKTVLCFFDGEKFIFSKGVLNGTIVLSPRGSNGFGYDSIFEVEGKTLAEMTLAEKSQISHRKIATVKLVNKLNEI